MANLIVVALLILMSAVPALAGGYYDANGNWQWYDPTHDHDGAGYEEMQRQDRARGKAPSYQPTYVPPNEERVLDENNRVYYRDPQSGAYLHGAYGTQPDRPEACRPKSNGHREDDLPYNPSSAYGTDTRPGYNSNRPQSPSTNNHSGRRQDNVNGGVVLPDGTWVKYLDDENEFRPSQEFENWKKEERMKYLKYKEEERKQEEGRKAFMREQQEHQISISRQENIKRQDDMRRQRETFDRWKENMARKGISTDNDE